MEQDIIEQFLSRSLRGDDGFDLQQVVAHEAGHRLHWMAWFPEVHTRYRVVCGRPGVIPDVMPAPKLICSMSVDEASRLVSVKLGGHAGEIVHFGWVDHAAEIGRWLARDIQALVPRLDWEEDLREGGDVSAAAQLIVGKTNQASLEENLGRALDLATRFLVENRETFDRECAFAEKRFKKLNKGRQRWKL